jgi:HD-GYP domain-containing protein (c-di-GMP phosphodiesterase class II)
VSAVTSENQDKVQSAGKNLLLYIFSMMKTGEIHDLNNEAWIRPSEKLIESLETIIRVERRSISFVVHEGIAQINSHALWLDRTTLEQAQELEQYLARREAGGIIFSERPEEEQLKKFFYQFARFRPEEGCEDQTAALMAALEADGVTQLKVAPQPLRLDGIGQGVRGVSALWYYSKGIAGIGDLLTRRPIEVKIARRTAQQLVDACAVEQDLLVGLALSGTKWSAERSAVDSAILVASVARGLGMSAIQCSDLATAAILHTVGHAYPNPDPDKISVDEAVATFALRQLVEGSTYTPLLAQRVVAAVEWRDALTSQSDDSSEPRGPEPNEWGQLLALSRHYLQQVRRGELGKGRSPVEVGLELLKSPPGQLQGAMANVFVACIGLLPVGTLVELNNGDVAVVSDVEHLRGRHLYSQRPAPITQPRKIFVERLRDSAGKVIPERQARVRLGDDGESGEWTVTSTLSPEGNEDLIVRGLIRRPSTVLTQLGVR